MRHGGSQVIQESQEGDYRGQDHRTPQGERTRLPEGQGIRQVVQDGHEGDCQ